MAKLTYAFPLIVGALALTACPGDDSSADGGGSSTGGADDNVDTTSSNPVTSATTDATTTGTPPGDSSTGTPPGCDPPCLPGQSCIGGMCIGEPETTGQMCDMWGSGEYADCLEAMCPGGSQCIVDDVMNPTWGVCTVLGCMDFCDCPEPPAGGVAACEDLTGDMQAQCFLDCSNDGSAGTCPDGFHCVFNAICVPGDPVGGVPPYGDCVNAPPGTMCDEGFCLADNPADPSVGSCVSPCMDVADCPMEPPGGSAMCIDVTGDMATECVLFCGMGGSCPDGMDCFMGAVCLWPVMDMPMGGGYGDCVNNPLATCEMGEDACVVDNPMNPMAGACSQSGCADAMECPAAPMTGNAVVTCGDVDGNGNTCYLDCSMGETCPDGMQCDMGLGACLWPEMGMALNEDFEGGSMPNGWTVNDVDGLAVDPTVAFVSDAWVVADQLEAGVNYAAYSTSWYAPAGTSDDWLVTPQIDVGAGSILSWDAMAPDGAFADGYEVYISDVGNMPADFMMNAPVFTIASEAQMFTPHTVDLAAEGFANTSVYIAFRNNSNDDFLLLVDNVQVTD